MASNTIKGITVKLGGDTKDLQSSFDKLDKKSRSIQKELNLVNKELKFNPDSSVLLAQKQELLEEKIQNSREALEKLDDMKDEVERKAKSGDLGADEYRAYQREVESTKNQLQKLETELGNTTEKLGKVQRKSGEVTFSNAENKIDHLKGKFKDLADDAVDNLNTISEKSGAIGDALESAGNTLNTGSMAAAAVLAGSVAAYEDLDEGYDSIVKKTGATGDALESLKQTADSIFSNNIFDMTDIGNAIGEVNTRFGFTDDKLKEVSESYLQFASINDTDVSDSVSKSARIMEAWNVSSENIPDLLGMITAKGQETGVAVDTLMDSVISNNSTFKEMGLSLEESIGLMAQFEKNGVDSSTALAALKAAVKNSTKEGKSLSEALGENVEKIKSASTETEALQVATELFGAKGAAEMTNSIREGRISFDNLATSMSTYSDTVKSTYEATLDPLDESKKAINNIKLAGSELASVALKEGEPLIEDVVDGIKSVTEWLKKLTPEQKKTLTKAIEIVAVAGPAVTIGGKIAKGISSIASTASTLIPKLVGATAAQSGLNVAMDANPVGAVVIAITALIAALGGLTLAIQQAKEQRFDDLGFTEQAEKMQESLEKVKEIRDEVTSLSDEIKSTMSDTTADMGIVDEYKDRLDELLEKANLSDAEQAELMTIGDYFSEKYPDFQTAWDKYKTTDAEGKEILTGNIGEIKNELDNLIEKYKKVAATEALSNMMSENTEAFVSSKQKVNEQAQLLQEARNELEQFEKDWGITGENLNSFLYHESGSDVWHTTDEAEVGRQAHVSDLREQYRTLNETINSMQGAYDEVVDSTAQFQLNNDDLARMQAVVNGNYEDASAVLMAYNSNLITSTDVENSKWKSLDNLKEKAKETAESTGSNMFFGLKNGIEKYKKQISDEGRANAKAYFDAFREEAEMNSPSKKMERYGKWFVQGFINGIKDGSGISNVMNAVKNIASTALNGIKSFLGISSPSKEAEKMGSFFGQGFVNGIGNSNKGASSAAKDLADSALSSLNNYNGKVPSFDLSGTYASMQRLKKSGGSSVSKTVSNISNSSNINNAKYSFTINEASDPEATAQKIADIIIRDGMKWG